ncbi:proteasome regulatory subunit-related protein [Reticulomyxa filosa]|uniref:Proteasome regulatory subunit-related protein n=1 Tax=Reticulomyxa filosa TaxID=46433 RepID=X6N7I4_RETFI|nr:proteasome regulatory subunit-related protein [Reticulomyxa filosa]|eukprot:ETO21991.1 proteasome regulatory subunit-related protein [Reticulomyxa filosa]
MYILRGDAYANRQIITHLQTLSFFFKKKNKTKIETFGSMVKREKCDFLLEQVRLCLAKRDYVRGGIIRNKITTKIMSNLEDLEIKYWNLSLIYFYHRDRNYLELSKAYRRLKDLLKSPEEKEQVILYIYIYSPFSIRHMPNQKYRDIGTITTTTINK